jgi:protein-tyrosine phosphatase
MALRKGDDKARRVALNRVIFVCLGNICRSPAAEGVMRGLAPELELELDSAGTAGWHAGDAPYRPMQDPAIAWNLDLTGLRARQFVPADFNHFDLIVALDAQN